MIFFTGFILILISSFVKAVLRQMGIWATDTHRWTDLLCMAPFIAGVGCWLWVIGVLCAKVLP